MYNVKQKKEAPDSGPGRKALRSEATGSECDAPVRQCQSAIRHVAMAMFMSRWRKGLIANFTAYFDESGSQSDTNTVVIAGFVAKAEEWIRFEREWGKVLEMFGVSAMHMRVFAHSLGEYATWKGNEGKRRAFLSRLVRIIRRRVIHSFASAVLMKDYHEVNREYELSETFSPYTIAGRNCVDKVVSWAAREKIEQSKVAFVFESGASDSGQLLRRVETDLNIKCAFVPKKESEAFEAADLLAYEHLLANEQISAGKVQVYEDLRYPLKELRKTLHHHDHDWGVFAAHNLVRLCEDCQIPKRRMNRSVQ